MDQLSPGIAPIISIDRRAATPLHRQIYEEFRKAIVQRDIRPGQQVPSSRNLALELSISRIPVLNAYSQLLAEGYFESRAGSGTFVSTSLPERMLACKPTAKPAAATPSGPRAISRRSQLVPHYRNLWRLSKRGPFVVHQPAVESFPFRTWTKIVNRHIQSPRMGSLHHIDPLGLEPFRRAICDYLRTARAVRCSPEQIMIVSGSQQALDLCSRVLFDPGDAVWMEEPGYFLAQNTFKAAGCRMIPIPVDGEGLDVAAGVKACPKARAAYVTPSHQYPLGSTMSASRRMQLLNWAQASGAWILEDDYDSEYRYESQPIASLQGLDQNARVIYIGTFSKVLFMSLRVGYLVLPPDLVERFSALRFSMDISPPYLLQEALTDFMREGHFARHLRRMRLLYNERRSALAECIRKEFGDRMEIHGSEAGMALTVTFPDEFSDEEITGRAERENLWVIPLSPSYLTNACRQGFILGFGSTATSEIASSTRRLATLMKKR